MIQWIKQINILFAFVLLFCFHGILYYYLSTPGWLGVTLMATVVDTAVFALVQRLLPNRSEHR